MQTENLEHEQKYEVEVSTPVPSLLELPGVERVADPTQDLLEAVYFDTPDLDLAARRITLRRRTGGIDHGWHLKLPAGPDQRQEIRAPLGQPDTVPAELLDRIQVHTRGKGVRPVAHLGTERTTHRLYGPGGEHLADFVDDQVHAEPLQPSRHAFTWREWEIELLHDNKSFFTAAEKTLTSTGAEPSRHSSKLARALGDAWPDQRGDGTKKPRGKGPAADAFTSYLAAQIGDILVQDPAVRREEPDAVHQMRSATRRIRSALAVYRRILKKSQARRLQDELKWLARILGRARDAEVMRERLHDHLRQLPDEHRTGPALAPADHELNTSYTTGYQAVLKALGAGRYYRLLDALETCRDHPPVKGKAHRPARKTTAKLANRTRKRLTRSHKAVKRTTAVKDRDTALHQVRKDAKRLRHAAESVTDIHGKRARKLAKSAKRLQTILGDHQDSVVARAFLRRFTADPGLPASTGALYRSLHEIETAIAADTEAKYPKARRKATATRLRP